MGDGYNNYEMLRNTFSPWHSDEAGRVLYRIDAVNDEEAALALIASLPAPLPAPRRWWERLLHQITKRRA